MVWREIVLLAEHGASAMAAIKAGTSGGARLLGLDDHLGTIEPGKLADLVLVDGDPTADLRRLATPTLVMKGGGIVSRF
jgi:imidazolonepropionase-like amidohydrolase